MEGMVVFMMVVHGALHGVTLINLSTVRHKVL